MGEYEWYVVVISLMMRKAYRISNLTYSYESWESYDRYVVVSLMICKTYRILHMTYKGKVIRVEGCRKKSI